MDFLVQSPNRLTLLVNYPNEATTISIFKNSPENYFVLLKPPMTSRFHLRKVSIEIFVSARTEIIFWWIFKNADGCCL